MIGDKKGLSTIVVTLIIVLLSLVAVGIVWAVIRNLVAGGGANIEIGSKCLGVEVTASKVNCSNGAANKVCDVTFAREGTGSDEIGGVKLVFKNSTTDVHSSLITVTGNIEPLVGLKQTGIDTTVTNADGVDSVDVTVFFDDESGNEQLCSQTTTKAF